MLLSGAAAGTERGGGAGSAAGGAPQCVGTMARWLREHLGFRSAKPAPPAPPKPDYRAGPPPPQPPPPPGGAAEPLAAAQPDIVAAYRLQKERDFEDPYSAAPPPPPAAAAPADGPRYVSPKHRLIKVEAVEKVSASPPPPPLMPAAPSLPPTAPEPPNEPPQEVSVCVCVCPVGAPTDALGCRAGLSAPTVGEKLGPPPPHGGQVVPKGQGLLVGLSRGPRLACPHVPAAPDMPVGHTSAAVAVRAALASPQVQSPAGSVARQV